MLGTGGGTIYEGELCTEEAVCMECQLENYILGGGGGELYSWDFTVYIFLNKATTVSLYIFY